VTKAQLEGMCTTLGGHGLTIWLQYGAGRASLMRVSEHYQGSTHSDGRNLVARPLEARAMRLGAQRRIGLPLDLSSLSSSRNMRRTQSG
jgi:hypothetical protein